MADRQSSDTRGLKRSLGLPALLFYGVGVIIGAGIYSIIGAAAGQAGRAVWISLALASVPAILAALCYAELCTRFPKAGGSYVYVREAFPRRRWPPFMMGFVMACTAAATAATVAVAFAGYLALFLEVPGWLGALLLLAGCTAVNIAGIRESAWVTVVATVIEVAGLLLIIGAGLFSGRFGEGVLDPGPEGFAGVLSAAALCFFVFTGFEGLANLAEETRRPGRTLPAALLVSVAVTLVLYVLVGIAAVSLVEPRQLAGSDSPLATAARAADARLASALGWIALFSTANTALITLVVASRLVYGMARGGDMPAPLARTLPGRRSPWVAALAVFALCAAMLPVGDLSLVGSIASLLTLIVFLAVAAALVALRVRGGEGPSDADRFRVPGSIGRVPLAPVLLAAATVALGAQFPGGAYLVAGGALGAGALLSLTRVWWAPSPPHHGVSQEPRG